jgi:uncharacterized membrane protein YecN with MAPEG domain
MIGAVAARGNAMTVTPLYAGMLALLYVVLGYRVVQMRGKGMPSLGDGGLEPLQRRIRGHGNFAEYVPLLLLMLGVLELGHLPAAWLHALGASLLVARVLHGIALSFTASWTFGRFWGTALTFLLLAVEGVLCLCQAFAPFWLAAA